MRHHSIPFVVLHVCDTIRTMFKPIRNNASRMFATSKVILKRFIVVRFRLLQYRIEYGKKAVPAKEKRGAAKHPKTPDGHSLTCAR